MNSRTVRFVHRPTPDEKRNTLDGRAGSLVEKQPFIDPQGIRPSDGAIGARRTGWLRGAFSKLLRAGSSEGNQAVRQTPHSQSWVPK
jgi:hypothetical protein